MPTTKAWLRKSLDDMSCTTPDDHSVILWLNCPGVGIIPSAKYDYFLTVITNFLADFPKNSICVIIHPNRAALLDRRTIVSIVSVAKDLKV